MEINLRVSCKGEEKKRHQVCKKKKKRLNSQGKKQRICNLTVITLFLQMWKLKYREVESPSQPVCGRD